ncbi:methyl-accepting chemotaxis protein [Vibrio sp. D431a]|uniref:methyl-accepting chemotaxis protein n=1 Tax=Vibrio sp. D431a TaxID=2837388 RepID=UPI002553DB00|nr:methyl-accepting chemotaxis protein [Vibrio sp. D431a]MDK9789930.1 methyl-accepting chemotaxis protein [Vibrio sp. D431a]
MRHSLLSLSIKNKLIATMALSSLALCGGFGYKLVDKFEESETSSLLSVKVPSVIHSIDSKVEMEIGQLINASEDLASNQFIVDALKVGLTPENELQLQKTLKHMTEQYKFYDASIIDTSSNKYWNQNGFLKTLTRNEDQWYFASKGTYEGTNINTFREVDGTYKVFVNYQDQQTGIITATSKSMNAIKDFLNTFNVTDNTHIFLTDSEGNMINQGHESFGGKKSVSDLYSESSNELLNKSDVSIVHTERNGEDYIVASSYIDSLDWYVVLEIPSEEAFAEVHEAKMDMTLITALIALLVTLASVFIANSIVRPIERIADVFKDIGEGEGDLRTRIPVKGNDEIAHLSSGFNSFIENIHNSVKLVAETATELNSAASSVDGYSSKTLSLCDLQSDITIQTVTAINEMGATVNEIASNAAVAAEQAAEVDTQSAEGQKVVVNTKDTIRKLSEDITGVSECMSNLAQKTDSIERILDVIRDISEQTNLLALNAAIEAARAGEHGRGFSVVADEVRTLASRTNNSIDDIQSMIVSLQKEAQLAVESIEAGKGTAEQSTASSESAREAISTIAKSIGEISSVNYQVAAATEEQATVVDELNRKVDDINQITQDNRDTAGDLSRSSAELKELSVKLENLVSEFKL